MGMFTSAPDLFLNLVGRNGFDPFANHLLMQVTILFPEQEECPGVLAWATFCESSFAGSAKFMTGN